MTGLAVPSSLPTTDAALDVEEVVVEVVVVVVIVEIEEDKDGSPSGNGENVLACNVRELELGPSIPDTIMLPSWSPLPPRTSPLNPLFFSFLTSFLISFFMSLFMSSVTLILLVVADAVVVAIKVVDVEVESTGS